MEQTSATLLMRLKQDGASREIAWTEFHRRYAPIIAGFARNLGVKPGEIDDMIQDVITGFYAAQPRFTYDPSRGRFRGYLKTCVVHRLSRRAIGKLPTDGRPVEMIDPADDSIERTWQAAWEAEHLRRAIEDVRKHYGDNATFRAFHRVVMERADASAVAKEMSLSIDTVYQAKSRCLARLRSVLKQIEDEEG